MCPHQSIECLNKDVIASIALMDTHSVWRCRYQLNVWVNNLQRSRIFVLPLKQRPLMRRYRSVFGLGRRLQCYERKFVPNCKDAVATKRKRYCPNRVPLLEQLGVHQMFVLEVAGVYFRCQALIVES